MSELIETYRGAVYPWHCDHMGHMNVMWYVGKFDEATWNLFALLGVTTAFLKENRRGELHAGDTVTVHSAFLEVRDKAAKFVHEMRNGVSGEIAAICVLTGVHTDSQTRKSCAFPPEILERGRSLVRAYELPER
jgi:acyl-CoA thioester hydrolase